MPPKAGTGNVSRSKPRAFKPPRQVSGSTTVSTASTRPGKGKASQSGPKATEVTVNVGKRQLTALEISSDEEEDEEEDEDTSESDHNAGDSRMPAASNVVGSSEDVTRPAIPPKLLARLLHNSFEDGNTKISKESMAVIGKYMETFVREALARAAFERDEAERNGNISDGFLQVEDLEKLAPQLLLDF